MSVALEFESKISHTRSNKAAYWASASRPTTSEPKSFASPSVQSTATVPFNPNPKASLRISDSEKQTRYLKGECFRCGDKYGPGHRCNTGTLKMLEVDEDPVEQPMPEVADPDEHLCSLKQTGTVQEYRQEFAKRSSRVSNWPDHCLLGVFLNGLKE